MVETVLKEITQAPGLFEELVKLQQENIKLKGTIRFLERLVDRFKPDVPPDVQAATLVNEIKEKAEDFVADNISKGLYSHQHILLIETAMFIGASTALGSEVKG